MGEPLDNTFRERYFELVSGRPVWIPNIRRALPHLSEAERFDRIGYFYQRLAEDNDTMKRLRALDHKSNRFLFAALDAQGGAAGRLRRRAA